MGQYVEIATGMGCTSIMAWEGAQRIFWMGKIDRSLVAEMGHGRLYETEFFTIYLGAFSMGCYSATLQTFEYRSLEDLFP